MKYLIILLTLTISLLAEEDLLKQKCKDLGGHYFNFSKKPPTCEFFTKKDNEKKFQKFLEENPSLIKQTPAKANSKKEDIVVEMPKETSTSYESLHSKEIDFLKTNRGMTLCSAPYNLDSKIDLTCEGDFTGKINLLSLYKNGWKLDNTIQINGVKMIFVKSY